MKAYVKTWRYGIETTIPLHGAGFEYSPDCAFLAVVSPILSEGKGRFTGVTIVSGDEFTVVDCPTDCEFHPADAEIQNRSRDENYLMMSLTPLAFGR